MSRASLSPMTSPRVGNDFSFPRGRLSNTISIEQDEVGSVEPSKRINLFERSAHILLSDGSLNSYSFRDLSKIIRRNRFILLAVTILLIGVFSIEITDMYRERMITQATQVTLSREQQNTQKSISDINMTVPQSKLQTTLRSISHQPVQLVVGVQSITIPSTAVQSWIQVTPNRTKTKDFLHVNINKIASSLDQAAQSFVKAPINQVSVSHTDGVTPSGVILAGQNGVQLADPDNLAIQAKQLANKVLTGKGLQFSSSLQSVPFQAVTPAAFSKLLEVDVTTKRMYAYQNGQLVNTFLVSAGKPSTPTPLGEFHIWDQETVQTMTGPGYVQPNVHWISYFDHSGDAIHGNYWRPASVFGAINTSHGCVGIPDDQAKWVYDWAPIGTAVINYD